MDAQTPPPLPLTNPAPWLDRFVEDAGALAAVLIVFTGLWALSGLLRRGRALRDALPAFVPWLIDFLLLPPTIVIAGALLRVLLRGAGYGELDPYVRDGSLLLTYLVAAWLIARGVDIWVSAGTAAAAARRGATRLLRGLMYAAALVVGATVFLAAEGYSITGVLVSTGVIAAVVALALQNTLSDFFSGVALSVEQPIRVGDWIQLENGTIAQVVDITWRAVWLTSWQNTRVVVPNSKFAGQTFENLNEPTGVYAPWYQVRVPADLPPAYALMLLREAVLRCKHVLPSPAPVVRLADATTIPYTYMVWVHFANYPAMFRGREEMFREIDTALRGVEVEPGPEITEFRTRISRTADVAPPTVAAALRAMNVLSGLDDVAIQRLAQSSRYMDVEAGQVLIREGEVAEAMYAIVAGILEASVVGPDHQDLVSERLPAGQAVGQISLITGEPSAMTVTAATDATVVRVSLDALKTVVADNPDLKDRLAQSITDRIAHLHQAKAAAVKRIRRPLGLREVRARLESLLRGGL
ncbi:MAG: mechanosensitive ion channel [Alphaproteobacteria bacterium]|jgi:small-conductance mechanosensitive channel/CRP-like cAMP-binding protein|nr:mechanosensitive ion channel [Alphaproteobacteria bacterium]